MRNDHDEYLETRVLTATPQELHLMVIDGAVRFATQAEEAMKSNDIETAHLALNRSREFVTELISGLDQDRTDDVMQNLRGLFGFVYRNLTHADLEKNSEHIRAALTVLHMHRDTWNELIKQLKTEQSQQFPATETTSHSWAS